MKSFPTLAVALLTGTMAYAQGSKLAADLKGVLQGSQVDVIVQYQHPPTAAHHQKIRQRGGLLNKSFELIRGAHYTVPAALLDDLANDPEVVFVSPNRSLKSSLDIADQSVNGTIAAQYGYDGTGATVAVIDSGIGSHEDLRGTVLAVQDFIGGGTDDLYGHGTHVAGIIAGSGYDSAGNRAVRTFRGMAPGAKLLNFRALDKNGSGTDSSVISAIQAAINLKNTYNIRVINLSLGRPVYESYKQDPLCLAVEQAWKAGIVVVVAAGNSGRDNSANTNGYATITAPGNDPYVINRGSHEDGRNFQSFGRSDCQLQLQGADALRPFRQAGPCGPR